MQYYRGDKSWQTLNSAAVGAEPAIPTPSPSPATNYYFRGDKTWAAKSEFAPAYGTLTNGDLCTTNGTTVSCTTATSTLEPALPTPAPTPGDMYLRGDRTWATLDKTAVGLGSVTNDAQTKASIVPNTAPAAGQILVGNAGGTAYEPVTISGDGTLSSAGVITLTLSSHTQYIAQYMARIGTATYVEALIYLGGGVALAGVSDTTGKISRSTDSGATWGTATSFVGTTDILSFASLGGGVVLAGDAGAGKVYKSTNSGVSWDDGTALTGATQVRTFAYLGGTTVLAGGNNGKVYKSTNSGDTWDGGTALTGTPAVYALAYLGGTTVLAGGGNGKVYKSTNSGDTWDDGTALTGAGDVMTIVSLGSGVALAGTASIGSVYKTTDYGGSFSLVQRLGLEVHIPVLASLGNGVVLAGTATTGQIYRFSEVKLW
ncbi:membrane protein [Candidatus Magnetobacterium bavaricum]|uniref:Membrane protein n=1 Tax=Candidatus Magnetobacterium bavaricum TaxID=29290 RepID=A0A0F3GPL4_9BACT|nr:membrane protein [Candidatus Magnetobacterium bavaricum]